MRYRTSQRNILWTVLFSILAILSLNACSDTNNVSGPPGPGPLALLTSSPLPAGTTGVAYNITLAPNGGTPPYTLSLAPGSALPNGLELTQSTGNIVGAPTAVGTTQTVFKLQDSKGESIQKTLSITVNISPTTLAILTPSLDTGTINQPYADALGGTGGTTPYRWGLKAGSPDLPEGLKLTAEDGGIRGTPTETSNATHTFTLTDATPLTVEKSLRLSINAIPLSITTLSPLPKGIVGQPYSASLAASGGTGSYTWSVDPPLPNGLQFNVVSSGTISGTPQAEGTTNHTFTVTDGAQTTTKTLQLVIDPATPPPPPAPAPIPPSGPQNPPATINP